MKRNVFMDRTGMQRWQLLLVAIFLAGQIGYAQAETPPESAQSTDKPKFVGAIVTALLGNVLNVGAQALINQFIQPPNQFQTNSLSANARYDAHPQQTSAVPCYATTPAGTANIPQAMRDELRRSGCQLVSQFLGSITQGVQSLPSNIVNNQGQVPSPLAYDAAGIPNYQGLKVAVQIVDATGRVIEERPIGNAFYTGEKFRLRVQSTFPGFLEVLHTAPSGVSKRLFPRPEIGQFMINAGAEITLPLNGNVYEFSNDSGIEQLVFSVRDPRTNPNNPAANRVYRQDESGGSVYAQQVQVGQFPSITQPVQIVHRATR